MGKGAATKKLPTPKFKFLLGFQPLYFENTYDKQIYKYKVFSKVYISIKVGGALPTRFQSWVSSCPSCPPPPCSYAYGRLGQGLGNDFQVERARAPPLETYLPPNSNFSSDFGHLISKMPIPNKKKNKCIFSSKCEGRRPPPVSKLEG